MKFLIQTIEGEVVHDFAFTLIQQIKAHNKMYAYKNDFIEFVYSNKPRLPFSGNDHFITQSGTHEFLRDIPYIPIGSVEFVSDYIQYYYGIYNIKPINIPASLNQPEFLKRKIGYCTGVEEILEFQKTYNKKTVFTKSNERYKQENAQLHWTHDEYWGYAIHGGEYFCSEPIGIASEWRGFVHRHKLLDIRNYSGDPFIFPDHKQVRKMMGSFEDSPIAYTIDVAILETGETVLIEIHDFFSCGLYGFDNEKLPWMYSQWFHEFLKRN